jgi:hypothetical protein
MNPWSISFAVRFERGTFRVQTRNVLTLRHCTVGRTPLDEWSARSRELHLITYNTHSRQISMPPLEFEPTISEGERPQNYALDRAATETDVWPYALQSNTWLVPYLKFLTCSETSHHHHITTNFHLLARRGRSSNDFITQLTHNKIVSFNVKQLWRPLTVQITRKIR